MENIECREDWRCDVIEYVLMELYKRSRGYSPLGAEERKENFRSRE